MKKVFVTGASGFLGSNLIKELLNQNYKVKGFDWNFYHFLGPVHEDLELLEGDALQIEASDFSDCEFVIHTIGETRPNLPLASYEPTNVQAALQVLRAAIQNKCKKFIFVSTANTIGYADDYGLGHEELPIRAPYDQCNYALSKLRAEELLLQYADKIDVLIANPTFIIGPLDSKPTSNRIIKSALHKRFIFYPPGGKNFVHVKDVALGLIRIMEMGKNGEKYLLAGENLSFFEFYQKLVSQFEKPPILIKIPSFFLKILGWVGDFLSWIPIQTSLSSVNMRILCLNNFYTNDKSKRMLKLRYHSIEKAIIDGVLFFTSRKK